MFFRVGNYVGTCCPGKDWIIHPRISVFGSFLPVSSPYPMPTSPEVLFGSLVLFASFLRPGRCSGAWTRPVRSLEGVLLCPAVLP